jgi:peptide/nickel transport system substrate-binding protein
MLQVAVIGNASFVENFNPFSPNAVGMTNHAVYEPLVVVNYAKSEVVPWLASSYQFSDDAQQLTFTLNDGIKWSDGEALTADDVVYTFGLARQVLGEASFSYVADIQAPDEKTVVFSFNRPFTLALYEIGQQVIVPEHIWSGVDDPTTFLNEKPVGSGPFTEVTNFTAQSIDFLRNPNYWQADKANYPGIRVISYGGNDAATAAAINGEVDWGLGFVQDIQKVYVDPDPEHRAFWFPGTGATISVALNTTMAPFDDVNLRKAISMAIDRDAVAETGMSGYTHAADCTGLSDAYDAWRDPAVADNCDWTAYDPEGAAALLDESGYTMGPDGVRVTPAGGKLEFTLGVGSASSDWVAVLQVVSKNLEDVGISAPLNVKDWSQINEAMFNGTFTGNIEWSGSGVTPYEYYRFVMSCETVVPVGEAATQNFHRYCSPEADQLLSQFTATTDEAQQHEIMNQLQALYSADAPVIPLFPGPEWGAYNSTNFTGWPNADNPYATLSTGQSSAVLVLTTIKPTN